MATPNQIYGDVIISGNLNAQTFTPPKLSVADAAITGSAGQYIGAQKIGQQFQKEYAQPSAQNATVETKVIHVTRGATGTVMDVAFGAVVAAIGAATAVFDLLKNGVSILTGTVTLDSTTAAYVLKAGTLAGTTTVAGDVFELKVVSATVGGGTLAKGLFARLTCREDPN